MANHPPRRKERKEKKGPEKKPTHVHKDKRNVKRRKQTIPFFGNCFMTEQNKTSANVFRIFYRYELKSSLSHHLETRRT